MTEYVFDANPDDNEVDWSNPSSWYGGIVPDGADAQVIIPTVTFTNGGDYETEITIGSGESYAVQSVTIANNYLNLFGNLSMSGALDLETGSAIELFGSTLSFGSLSDDNISIEGNGQIVATGTLDNTGEISGGGGLGGGLVINAATFRNSGGIGATSNSTVSSAATTVTIHAMVDPDLVDGTLGGGGSYSAGGSGILDLDLGGLITTDAASIEIDNDAGSGGTGQINSFDAATGT